MGNFFKDHPHLIPSKDITPNKLGLEFFDTKEDKDIKLSWLGHSAFVINVIGIIIMLDPMLGQHAAPVPMPSLKRYSKEIAFEVDDIDRIDVVVYSHDHYDHLDYPTIKKIKNKVGLFIVPHGLRNLLTDWGVPEKSILELNWEESK